MTAMRRAAWLAAVLFGGAAGAEEAEGIEEVVVRAQASVAAAQGAVASVSTVDEVAIELARANHPNEILVRVPGVWVARASGQEHLTAIRSGVLAGPGACGGFLLLENGVPIRPSGFCNINNLFEMNTELANAIEVVRGPASALFGGNALHGAINTVTATSADGLRASMEVGPYGYSQARATAGGDDWRLDALTTSTNGYRDDTGFGQHKFVGGGSGTVGGWSVTSAVAGTLLNQETGGYVRGFEVYDSPLRRSNPNPEAYRDAWSMRASTAWRRELASGRELTLTPYARRSSMAFLQHFLPGQPLERNGQSSAGAQFHLRGRGVWRWTAGAVVEGFAATLSERQAGATTGSAFLVATRPPGTHYDYRVSGLTFAAFYDADVDLAEGWDLVASARFERNGYEYDNRHLVGNTRDDGSACGFGGCLYTRPADRDDTFTNLAGRIGLEFTPRPGRVFYAVAGHGFRPPQTTELYRLQRGQAVADLESETLRSLEAGWRTAAPDVELDLAVYVETTDNLIFRDADGYNVSDGETRSTGVEADFGWHPATGHAVHLVASYARHQYAFTRAAGRGERIVDGNDVDTAPRWLASARWRWASDRVRSEFESVYVGSHAIDAANTAHYDGHALLNWRGSWDATPRVRLFSRLVNVLDTAYADRADYAFGSYRYFPGMPRQVYVGVELN